MIRSFLGFVGSLTLITAMLAPVALLLGASASVLVWCFDFGWKLIPWV